MYTEILIAFATWAGTVAGLILFIQGANGKGNEPDAATSASVEPSTFLNHGDPNDRHYIQ